MTAAVAPHKGVVRPELAYAGVIVPISIRHYWRQYRFWGQLAKKAAEAGADWPTATRFRDESRGALNALLIIYRACRPVRIGGAM